MSYTSIVKNEVSKLDMVETENISELSAIIRNIGQIGENIKISSENASVSRRIFTLIKKIYHFNPKIVVRRGYNFNKNYIYIIEINPRIQGTFECVQQALGINMLEAHIKACQNEIIAIDKAEYYSYKKIIYSPKTVKYEKIDLNNLYDMPHLGSITQKDEPLLTIIDKDKDFDKLYEKVELSSQTVNKLANKSQ